MSHNDIAFKLINGIEVAKSDDRTYKSATLPNGLKVLAVSDPSTEMSAAAVEVSVGHFSDPEDIAGLAHFLEHECFLGTERFPDENSFSEFLAQNAGYSNAYTATEATNYHFCVNAPSLREALDRFSTFFSCPLFTESATERELQAVDSEHKKNLQQDMWRTYQLDKSTSRPSHPYHKFGTGDIRTLKHLPAEKGINVRQALLDFHAEHYSAGRMTLAVLGAEPVDTLLAWAADLFSAVKNNGSKPPTFPGHPHMAGAAAAAASSSSSDAARYSGIIQYVVPVRDVRTLQITWGLPEQKTDWRSKPGRYISQLLGHEGPGSLLSHLKAQGWATELYAGTDANESGFSTFSITCELSDDGLARVQDVIALVYAYLGALRAHGPQEYVFTEDVVHLASSFRFSSKQQPFEYVAQLASELAEFPARNVLTGRRLIWDWNPEGVEKLLAHFTPGNSRVRISSKSFEDKCTLRERWYDIHYAQEDMSAELIARLEKVGDAYAQLTKKRMADNGGKPVTGGRAALGKEAGDAAEASVAAARAKLEGRNPTPSFSGDFDGFLSFLSSPLCFPPLTLPAPNDFLATEFELRNEGLRTKQAAEEKGESAAAASAATTTSPPATVNGVRIRRQPVPTLVRSDARGDVWHHCDDFFAVPKVYTYFFLSLPAAYTSPRSVVLLELYVRLLLEQLNELSYAAALAGLHHDIHAVVHGVYGYLYGFSQKQGVLARKIGEIAASVDFSDLLFEVQKDKLVRGYANWSKESPYRHAVNEGTISTTFPRWSTAEKLKVVGSITAADLRAFVRDHLLRDAHFTTFVSGNATKEEAVAIADALTGPLAAISNPPILSQLLVPRVVQLPFPAKLASGTTLSFELFLDLPARNPADTNAGMDMLLQVGIAPGGALCKQTVMVELAGHILSEAYFDELRTKQQLGYIVSAGSKGENGVEYVRFLVQSSKVGKAEELVDRTDRYLHQYVETLRAMPKDKFDSFVQAVAVKRSEADKNVGEEANRLWEEIRPGTLDFSRASHEVSQLFKLTQEEFVAWFSEVVAPGGAKRRVFVALIERGTAAAAHGGGAGEEGDDEEEEGEEGEEAAADEPVAKKDVDASVGQAEAGAKEGGETAAPQTVSPTSAAATSSTSAAAAAASDAATIAAPDGTLARSDSVGGAGVPSKVISPAAAGAGATTTVDEKAQRPPIPSVTLTLTQASALSHILASAGPSVSVADAVSALQSVGAASSVVDVVKAEGEKGAPSIRLRVVLPDDGSAPALMRTVFPAYMDIGSLRRARYFEEHAKTSSSVAAAAVAVAAGAGQ